MGWVNESDANALHEAAYSYFDHTELIRALGGTHCADLNAQDNGGETPLHNAAYSGETAAARALLELGADASLRNMNGETALELAEQRNKHETPSCCATTPRPRRPPRRSARSGSRRRARCSSRRAARPARPRRRRSRS